MVYLRHRKLRYVNYSYLFIYNLLQADLMRCLLILVYLSSISCSSYGHIWKTKQDRPVDPI